MSAAEDIINQPDEPAAEDTQEEAKKWRTWRRVK